MTEQWQQDLLTSIDRGELLQGTLSQLRRKDGAAPPKTIVRPIQLKQGLHYQFEYHYANKVTHENVVPQMAGAKLLALLNEDYRQALVKTPEADLQLLFSKKGKATVLSKPPTGSVRQPSELQHNRQKQRILAEGAAAPFLVELGIMTKEGMVHAKKQDKYKQINRFLEMVTDVLPHLPKDRPLTIVDFGCGKSYLTFALYHLLAIEQQRDIRIIGLDLKADVISFCSGLADKLGYGNLTFMVGDIAEYEGLNEADMVVTLHACDTATDAALAKAVGWGASVIMSVPCCQHEAFKQIQNDTLLPLLSQGLLKERFAALATDAARGTLLEAIGYKVQMLEFVDPEHTPKNLLIRAVRGEKQAVSSKKWEQYEQFRNFLHLSPSLEAMLGDRLPSKENQQ
ncbi:class I SAM-dependent methyltransferase [Paenibacillus radicis (ex Gao et al. 2016)]|uniref:Methyltransferase n=1 Tax=Paenibacillus radicis (ex Gao et al. 2016) TaxID=1737354 RepID=A0A917HKF7_9BACL|nr:SAM-dependent methyltransferase [Paenibacillus radicis (ex Gao et al. 2016)]GGG82413.1 methyltransferase [Paenibacillus radicis (ex Gao et al. 2016)]